MSECGACDGEGRTIEADYDLDDDIWEVCVDCGGSGVVDL